MIIIFLGPQGSGKGTQARMLAEKLGYTYFDAGAHLRRLAKTNPQLDKSLKNGILIPDKDVFSYVSTHFESKKIYDNIVFDGYPRSLIQLDLIKKWLNSKGAEIHIVFYLDISEEETIRRLSARRIDPKTGKIYNLITNPPGEEIDKASLIQREDDQEQAIKMRLKLFHEATEPLVNKLESEGLLVRINGEQSIEEIQSQINKSLETKKNG